MPGGSQTMNSFRVPPAGRNSWRGAWRSGFRSLANAGKEYVIYVADRREIEEPGSGDPVEGELAFTLPAGSYHAQLVSPADGCDVGPAAHLEGGDVLLRLPSFVHDVVLHITADV